MKLCPRPHNDSAGARQMMENLWLGCGKAAANHSLLVSLDIRAVLIVGQHQATLTTNMPPCPPETAPQQQVALFLLILWLGS
jgi:hypothetical protein